MSVRQKNHLPENWRLKMHEVIFEADTPAGKLFDVILIISIILSVIAVMLDSVTAINQKYGGLLYSIEWFFTLLFTIEYFLRLMSVGKPLSYARSFYGIVDLIAILPTYLSILFPGTQYLLVVRLRYHQMSCHHCYYYHCYWSH